MGSVARGNKVLLAVDSVKRPGVAAKALENIRQAIELSQSGKTNPSVFAGLFASDPTSVLGGRMLRNERIFHAKGGGVGRSCAFESLTKRSPLRPSEHQPLDPARSASRTEPAVHHA